VISTVIRCGAGAEIGVDHDALRRAGSVSARLALAIHIWGDAATQVLPQMHISA